MVTQSNANSNTTTHISLHEIDMTIDVCPETELTISKRFKQKVNLPSFVNVGSGYKNRYHESIAYEKELLTFNKDEQKCFSLLLDGYDYTTGLYHLNISQQNSKTERNALYNGLGLLRSRNLVKKVKKNIYLVNPLARFNKDTFEQCILLWRSLP